MSSRRKLFAARALAGFAAVWLIFQLPFTTAQESTGLTPQIVLKGHTEPVYSVAISPDGALAATGSFDKSIKLWDVKTGKELRKFAGPAGHQNYVLNVAFSPNGDSLATGGSDNFARIWDIPVSSPVHEYIHAAGVNAVAVSPDGKLIAGACKDGSVKLWTTSDGKQAANLAAHNGDVTGVAFSANGQTLVSSGSDQTVCFWNVGNGQQLGRIGAHNGAAAGAAFVGNSAVSIGEDGFLKWWQLPPVAPRSLATHGGAVTAFALSPDGNTAISAGADRIVKLTAFNNGQTIKEFAAAGSAVNAVGAAPNSPTVVGGGADGKLYFWKTDDGKLSAQMPAHPGGVSGLSFHPTMPVLATVGADGMLRTWSFPVNALRSIATPDRPLAAILSADGKRLFSGADKIIRAWTFATGAMERQYAGHTGTVTALAVTPDGNTLASAAADETIRFWNVSNSMQLAQLSGHVGAITSLAINSQGTMLVSGGADGAVKIWQIPPVASRPFAHPDGVNAVALASDDSRALTVGNDKQVRIWNLSTGQSERSYTAGSGAVSAAAFAGDSNIVAIAGADKSLVVWNNGKETKRFALAAAANALAFAPNGATIAAGLADNSIRLLNVADGKEIKKIDGHTAPITALAYASKGDLLISGSADKTLRLWNAADGSFQKQFAHSGPIAALAIARDGKRIVAGGPDKKIGIWTLGDGKPAGAIETPDEVRGLSIGPDGEKIAVAGGDAKVRLYGFDGKLQEAFGHAGPVTGVAFLADGKRLISSSADRTARVWTSAFLAQGHMAGPVRRVVVSPQGDRVVTAGDKQLQIWDAKTGKEIKAILAHEGEILDLALSADATKAVTASADKSVKVWNLIDGKALTTITLPGAAQRVALSANGLRLAVAFADQGSHIRTYDAASGQELQIIADAAGAIHSLVFLSDNRTLVAAGDDKTLNVYDAALVRALPVHRGGAAAVAFHPNGAQIFTAGKDKFVRQWDYAAGKEINAFGPLAGPVNAMAFSRDYLIVGAAAGKVVKIWQVADAKEIATISHPAEVVALAFNPDRTRLITGATDHLARVWDIGSGRLLQSYSAGGAVGGVAFHPNQPFIITASADKTVVVHPLAIAKVVAASLSPLRALTVTANGSHVVTAGDDKLVKAWNAGSGADEHTYSGAEGPVYAVAVSKNGQLLAAGGADKMVRIYTFNDGKLIGMIPAPATVRCLAFHPTLPILSAACSDKSVNAWNIAFQPGQRPPPEFGAAVQSFAHAEPATAVAFSDRGELFSAGADKTVKHWRIAAESPVRNFSHPNLVDAVAFDPTGKLLATACHDGIIRVFDIEKNAAIKSINAHIQMQPEQQNHPIYSIAWSPDGKQLLSASNDRSLKLWDAAGGTLVREFKPFNAKDFPKGHHDQVFCGIFSKDGKFIASGSHDGTIKLWNTADGTVVREFSNPKLKQPKPPESPLAHPGGVYGLQFTADGKHLISVGVAPKLRGYVAAWDTSDGRLLYGEVQSSAPIYSVAITKDGTRLLLGCGSPDRMTPASDALIAPIPIK